MNPLLWPVLAASLVGSLHCVGMCGPIVAFYSGGDTSEGPKRWLGHLAYNGGRGVGYVLLGAVAGALGAAVDLAGAAAGIGRVAIVLAGIVMILWGLALLFQAGGEVASVGQPGSNVSRWWARVTHMEMPEAVQARFVALLRRLRDKPPVVRALFIGLATALMPCGWLYVFAVTAAGTGAVWSGALVMFAFWLGTVPVLLGVGVGVQALVGRLRRHVPVMAAILLILLGMYAVLGRLNIPSFAARAAEHGGHTAPLSSADAPCCH